MKVPYVPEGLEAIIFTADGDMRQALNNLQATNSGFRFVNQENVFKVILTKYPQIFYCLVCSLVVLKDLLWFTGLWPASPIACKEYGAQHTGREIWWCLFGSQAAIRSGLLPNRHNHNLFPYHKKLWYGWVFEIGVHEGTYAHHAEISLSLFLRSCVLTSLLLVRVCRKLDLLTWESVMELARTFRCVVFWLSFP